MSEVELLKELQRADQLDPLRVKVISHGGAAGQADAVAEVSLHGQSGRFLIESVPDAKPAVVRAALERMQRARDQAEGFDGVLLLAPHLAGKKLTQLIQEGFGGLDLSGNASVAAASRFAFHRDGRPPRIRERAPATMAYRGAASLVTRLLAREPVFATTSSLHRETQRRGGPISMGTVSKALAALEEDRAVGRFGRSGVRVLKPSYLLDRLAEEAKPVTSRGLWLGRTKKRLEEVLQAVSAAAPPGARQSDQLARTGASSASFYTAFAEEPELNLYCGKALFDLMAFVFGEQTNRFPNIRLVATEDRRAFFDLGPSLVASPVQAWLELRKGDPRQQDAGEAIRRRLIEDAERKLEAAR